MCAESFKEEGNILFKKKDFKTAVDNYTGGIKSRSPDKLLNAILYSNRAAAQFEQCKLTILFLFFSKLTLLTS